MKMNSKLTLAFLLLILVVPQVGADKPPKDGPYVNYYESGKKRLSGHFKNGRPDGPMTNWYENGRKRSEARYKNGNLVSASVWKPDGQPCPITKIVAGSGILADYHENGQQQLEGHFNNGKPDGLWTQWDENGKKKQETHYKNGKEISRKEF